MCEILFETNVESGFSKGLLKFYRDSIQFIDEKGKRSRRISLNEITSVCIKYENSIHIRYANNKLFFFLLPDIETTNRCYELICAEQPSSYSQAVNNDAIENSKCSHAEPFVKVLLKKLWDKLKKSNLLVKVIVVDVVLWIIFALFESDILPDKGGSMSGFFGLVAIFLLVLILAVISGFLGGEPSKTDPNERERQIRRETRIRMDEARRYNDNWKNARK